MNKTTSNLLFLAIGATAASIATYIVTSNKSKVWLDDINTLVNKIKKKVQNDVNNAQDKKLETPEDIITLEELNEFNDLDDLVDLNDL